MKPFVLLIALFFSVLYAYEDLGVYGETSEIKERDFRQLLKEKWEKADKKSIEEQLKSSVYESMIIKSNFKTCSASKVREFKPTVLLNQDIMLPYTNKLLREKGTYNILSEFKIAFPYSVIFINADDELQVELAQLYKEEYANKIQVMLIKGDYFKFVENPIFKDSKVARQDVEAKAFDLQCVPSIYTQQGDMFLIQEYNPKELLKNEKTN
jgi:hypothetical protein